MKAGKNYFRAGQLLRFVSPYLDDHGRVYELKYAELDRRRANWNRNGRRWADTERIVKLSGDAMMLFVKHCPGINSNWDRMPGIQIEHDCIAYERGHAIVIVEDNMFQVPYSLLRRVGK